jgi:hypothetical protein
MLKVYSKRDFVKLLKYFIKNKSIFLFTFSIAKAIDNDEVIFKDKELEDILNELCILLNMFSYELVELINIGKKNNYLFIKIPAIPVDLTRDIDVVTCEGNSTNIKSRFFDIFFDAYLLDRLQRQLKICNIPWSQGNHILRAREFLYLVIKDDFRTEIKRVPVRGLNEFIDYCLLVNNILGNGFVLYYDYLNLRRYTSMLRNLTAEKSLKYYSTELSFPSKIYPSLLLKSINLSNLFKFLKMIIDTDYTPVYGNMIEYVKRVALDLGLKKLAGALL